MSLTRRRFHRVLLGSLGAALVPTLASADLLEGRDWRPLAPPRPGGVPGKIEVLEFFSYGCPHCHEFDPLLTNWRKTLPADVVFRRVPVSFGRPQWAALGRLYLTLAALGLADKLDPAVFEAIHNQRIALHDEAKRNDWLAKQGVDVTQFNNTWKSFGVESQAKRAEQQSEAFKVAGVPALAIDGRYFAGGNEGFAAMLRNTDALIAMVRKDKPKAKK